MEQYVLPILFFVLIGAAAGILLALASKMLFVKTDETVDKITGALPGANCGGCGYSGCEGYAKAVAEGSAPANLCKPGGPEAVTAISEIMGIEAVVAEREYAYVKCNGNCDACSDKFIYIGTKSCAAIEKFYNGKGNCSFGCHGMGDCAAVCDNNAIRIENGIAIIIPELCGGCGKCIKACPNKLISFVKESQHYAVRCSSCDTGKITKSACKNGCIGCGICVKKCPKSAIVINNNHAEINSDLCNNCGACFAACPVKCIQLLPQCNK